MSRARAIVVRLSVALLAGLLLGAPPEARAEGEIDTAGATLTIGAAPSQGTVVQLACVPGSEFPTVPAPPSPGSLDPMTATLPAFPGAGDGSGGAFAATVTTTLPGGTYQFTSYTVDAGVEVTYSSAVTLLVTGDVNVAGRVVTKTADGSVTIRTGGEFRLAAGGSVATEMATSPIDVAVQGDFVAEAASAVDAADGAISVVTHGSGGALLGGATLDTDSGDVALLAAAGVSMTDGNLNTGDGNLVVRAFGGDLLFTGSADVNIFDGTVGITLEAQGGVRFEQDAFVNTNTGDILITAFAGDVVFAGGAGGNTRTGHHVYRASGSVAFLEDASLNTFTGDHRLTAFGGDVTLVAPGTTGTVDFNTLNGSTLLSASRDVTVNDEARLNHFSGDYVLRAGRDIAFAGAVTMNVSAGVLDLFAGRRASAVGLDLNLDGVSIVAGAGGVDLDLAPSDTDDGAFEILADGSVKVGGIVRAGTGIEIASLEGTVDLTEANLSTASLGVDLVDSGDITVVAVVCAPRAIDARGATLVTGDAAGTSGSIQLVVYDAGPSAVASFFLPKRVAVKLNSRSPGKSRLVAAGFFDTGPDPVDFTKPATLTIGTRGFAVPGLTPTGNGRKFIHREPGLLFLVKPNGAGSSRAKFRIVRVGDLAGEIDPEAELEVDFSSDDVDANGQVGLDDGRYALGRVRGALIAPNLFLSRVKATVKGGGGDSLLLRFGLATGGEPPPAEAPDVTIEFGDSYAETVPGTEFASRDGKFVFRGDAPGITQIVLDYAKELVTVKGRGLDLGDFPPGAQPVEVALRLGADARAVRVRMVRRGAKLLY